MILWHNRTSDIITFNEYDDAIKLEIDEISFHYVGVAAIKDRGKKISNSTFLALILHPVDVCLATLCYRLM